MVSLDRCNGTCDILGDLNLIVFNVIIRKNEWKTLVRYISCDCKCTFSGRKLNSNQK